MAAARLRGSAHGASLALHAGLLAVLLLGGGGSPGGGVPAETVAAVALLGEGSDAAPAEEVGAGAADPDSTTDMAATPSEAPSPSEVTEASPEPQALADPAPAPVPPEPVAPPPVAAAPPPAEAPAEIDAPVQPLPPEPPAPAAEVPPPPAPPARTAEAARPTPARRAAPQSEPRQAGTRLRPGGGDSRPGADVPSTAPAIGPVASAAPATVTPAAGGGPLLVTAPRYRRTPTPPQYPSRALDLGITGTVLVRARVAPGGETEETRVWRSSGHPMLDAAALAAVRRWAFEPASIGGRQVESWVEVPVHFRLN